ncbi:MAG: response regulator [Oxalicibacterium faecigallinarum]|uniref:hybrid sensor histidine kinase/response regulator n=1 Tax=Oxalicibacterium faecigallinarum TaxID=573741 RepID=UPI00280857EE|nr:response regulator [Oxalicibacterium faecigallinarum]MDQ7968455.1 response regulator [Oxalicibacterium faecigallinarum]
MPVEQTRTKTLILNVDDNDGARYAKSRILRLAGFEVIEAMHGAGAIQQASDQSPDLILLDTKLPDINGFEVCQMLRANLSTSKILILQTSASFLGSSDKIRALEGGADNYLVEPIESEELIANIKALLRLRQVESELSESELRFSEIAQNIDDVFWMFVPNNGQLLYVNPAYQELFMRDPQTLSADPLDWLNSVHEDDRDRVEALFKGLLNLNPYETEYRLSIGGREKWIGERGYCVKGEGGTASRVARVSQDVSARKLSELQTQTADRRKDEFLATLAHELRNPLGPILHAVQLMGLSQDLSQIEKGRLMIERQTRHLMRLVDDLLDISRITQGKVNIRCVPLSVKTFVMAAVEATQAFLDSRRHTLSVELPEDDLKVLGDVTRLSQVIANLLNNAAKYTVQGGHISLKVSVVGNQINISVSDNGIGISRENIGHIFDLFVQADHASDRAQDGLGIGLSLVKNLVTLHGGQVCAKSDGVERGSTFEVWLPILTETVDDETPQVISQEHVSLLKEKAKRVMVVDDNIDATEMLVMALKTLNFEVAYSYDGPSALVLAESFLPDVVILDIGLPGMTGYEVATQLRAKEGLSGTRLIALSGYGKAKDRARAIEAGFDHHFLKPAAVNDLLPYLTKSR